MKSKLHRVILSMPFIIVVLLAGGTAFAQDVSASAATGAELSATAPTCDAICEAGKVKAAYDAYRAAAPGVKNLVLFALLAAGLQLLIKLGEYVGKISAPAKKWLPLVAAGLGVLVAVSTKYAAGEGWAVAILYGLSGPLAVFVNELGNLWPGKKAAGS